MGYVNHEGRYADIRNVFGVENNSVRMTNRAGVAAGKYLGRHVLEGELSYDNRMYHRYGAFVSPDAESLFVPGAAVDFGDANIDLRIGDDFQDLSRTNFEVAFRGGMFFDHSEWPEAYGENARQLTLEGHGRIARAFGRSSLSATLGYEYLRGQRSASGYDQGLLHAALHYGFAGGVVPVSYTHLLEAMPPFLGGGDMVDRVTFAGTTFAPVPLKFEAGTANFVGAIALGRAVEFLQEFDPAEIEAHETAPVSYTHLEPDGYFAWLVQNIRPYSVSFHLQEEQLACRIFYTVCRFVQSFPDGISQATR